MGLIIRIFQINAQDTLFAVFDEFVVPDVPFALHQLGHFGLDPGTGYVHAVHFGFPGVANPGQHIGNWIGGRHFILR
jgi:hypothetical protein